MEFIRGRLIRLVALCVMSGFAGCSRTQESTRGKLPIEKTRPLPEVAAGETNYSSFKPAIPYEELGPSILARTIVDAVGPAGYHVEVRDLRVDAKRRSEDIRLPGAAFLEVLDGSGVLIVGGKPQEAPTGATFSISQGQSFTLEVRSDQPLTIRARVVRAE
jgi:hypothetical protein